MSHRRPSLLWTSFVALAVATGPLFAADDTTSSDGYKTVNIDSSGKPVPIRVQQQHDALAHAHLTDELDHQRAFSGENPMANKTYPFAETSAIHGTNDYNKKSDENTFITKPYAFTSSASTVPNLNAKPGFHSTQDYTHTAAGFDKPFAGATADAEQNKASPFATTTASEQGREAVLGGGTVPTEASPLTSKKFEGDEADAAQRQLKKLSNGQIEIENVPDRPLTIDEVRQLINHGFTPDTTKPSEAPSKPLNDPNYVPQPLRDNPSAAPAPSAPTHRAGPVLDDDKDDPVPPPGTMSASPPPENAQPLPQP